MHSRHLSTLHLLGLFAFTALALNDDSFILGVGSFKLSPFDVIFVAILVVKAMRRMRPFFLSLIHKTEPKRRNSKSRNPSCY